ncbi:hypothetical protein ACPV5S_15525 [Vibrio astriarenae]
MLDALMKQEMAAAAQFAEDAQERFNLEDQKAEDDKAFAEGIRGFRPTHKCVVLYAPPTGDEPQVMVNSDTDEVWIFQNAQKAQKHISTFVDSSIQPFCYITNAEQPAEE